MRFMPDSDVRRGVVGNRREGRRSLSAYGSYARGIRYSSSTPFAVDAGGARATRRPGMDRHDGAAFNAGIALALVYPLTQCSGSGARKQARRAGSSLGRGDEGTGYMKGKPSITSLETLSLDESAAYLEHADGDELNAAYALAWDRNRLDGSDAAPDDAEVHHALFLLCRARGKRSPSFDDMRVELRRRVAA